MTLCFITDRSLYGRDAGVARARLIDAVAAAARAGVDLIQVRERDLDDRALLGLVRDCLAAVEGTRSRLVVNDRLDVAIAAAADGVHLRGDAFRAARVRDVAPSFLVGRSVHAVEEAAAADGDGGYDYLIAGTIFATPAKGAAHVLLGVEGLRRLCAAVRLPVLAVGGLSVERAADAIRAGAAGIAGIRLFADSATVADVVVGLRRVFDTHP